jgi:hypothetical protein
MAPTDNRTNQPVRIEQAYRPMPTSEHMLHPRWGCRLDQIGERESMWQAISDSGYTIRSANAELREASFVEFVHACEESTLLVYLCYMQQMVTYVCQNTINAVTD